MICLEPDFGHGTGNALCPLLFAKFYSRLLYRWIKELDAGNYISVKFFDDVVNYFFKGIPSSCGIDGLCRNQYVVEADGGVYPCDFYATDRYKIGDLTESTPREINAAGKTGNFLNEKPSLAAICKSCDFLSACGGGCKRMRNVMYAGTGGTVCGFRLFLEKCLKPLEQTVREKLLA